ncbi:PREDICTED: fatty acid-binding protein, heart-like [Branchiostoma belcheri]|uniref:Fatty acid-binding protein, heart-like n=1 Tax=Branchiostoma belcheri TaxID=7741 RepID=A0A6P5AKI6_BRABE|nr:PREDICTED: fatty acid-binding protein, heart-like [Branchiostoma belcheri]
MSPPERVDLSGTWKMVHVENFDAYLQALGIGFVLRAIAKMLSNTQIIEQDGDSFYVKDINTLQTHEVSFRIGVPVEGTTVIGKYKVTVTWDGDVLRGYTETDKGIIRTERYIREDGTMLYSMTAPNGVKTTQIFVKQ